MQGKMGIETRNIIRVVGRIHTLFYLDLFFDF
jgi:hypothetical protein